MKLRVFEDELSICKLASADDLDLSHQLTFAGVTDEEISLVCPTCAVPERTIEREDGWRALRIEGVLDFSLVGILSRMSGALANAGVGLFAVSTFNTDYVLVKADDLSRALEALANVGFE